MSIKKVQFTLTGVTPLLMHWDNIPWSDELKEWEKAHKKDSVAGDDRSPAWRWLGSVYHDDKVVAVPSDNLRTGLMNAAAGIGTGKGKVTFKRKIPAGLLFEEPFLPLEVAGRTIPIAAVRAIKSESFADHIKAVRELGFELLVKRARVNTSKHVRVRPQFRDWQLTGQVTLIDDDITMDVLGQVFDIARRFQGLCDWRPGSPSKPGPYGQYSVKLKAA